MISQELVLGIVIGDCQEVLSGVELDRQLILLLAIGYLLKSIG